MRSIDRLLYLYMLDMHADVHIAPHREYAAPITATSVDLAGRC